jgi:hypothetical protein
MAYGQDYDTLAGLVANSTGLANSQFYAVKLATTAGKAVISGALNTTTGPAAFVGVLQNAPAGGEEVEFAYRGLCKMKVATSTIAIGDRVGVNSTGLGTDAGVTDNIFHIGRAVTASGAANDIITVCLYGSGGQRY